MEMRWGFGGVEMKFGVGERSVFVSVNSWSFLVSKFDC
jgi:hypothetical protein